MKATIPTTMRVVFLAWRDLANPLAGGSEVTIDRLAAGLAERGHDVTLLCGGPHDADRPYRVERAGGKYTQYIRVPIRALRRHRRADLVIDVCNGVPFWSPLWRRRPTVCLIHHVHRQMWRMWFPAPVARLGWFLESRAMPWVYRHHLFITVSPSTAQELQALGVDAARIRLVHNGVDWPATVTPKTSEPRFMALGRLVPHKRFDLLLRAWERVRPETGGTLVITGSGPERERLQAMAGPGVVFTGQVTEDVKQWLLGQAWLLVHPSALEGWGLVVTEAAAAGTPTLAFNVPGLRDSVVNGTTGVLTDDEDALVEQWIVLASDTSGRHRLGHAARRRAAGFTWAASVEHLLRVAAEATGLPVSSPSQPASIDLTSVIDLRDERADHPARPGAERFSPRRR